MRYLVLIALGALLAPAQTEIRTSAERRMLVGKHMAEETLRRFARISEGPAVDYLRQVSSRLAQASDTQPDVQLHLILGTSNFLQEPWVYPGGIIIFPVKLYQSAESEDEFAAMIAHAIGHVADEQQLFRTAPVQRLSTGAASR